MIRIQKDNYNRRLSPKRSTRRSSRRRPRRLSPKRSPRRSSRRSPMRLSPKRRTRRSSRRSPRRTSRKHSTRHSSRRSSKRRSSRSSIRRLSRKRIPRSLSRSRSRKNFNFGSSWFSSKPHYLCSYNNDYSRCSKYPSKSACEKRRTPENKRDGIECVGSLYDCSKKCNSAQKQVNEPAYLCKWDVKQGYAACQGYLNMSECNKNITAKHRKLGISCTRDKNKCWSDCNEKFKKVTGVTFAKPQYVSTQRSPIRNIQKPMVQEEKYPTTDVFRKKSVVQEEKYPTPDVFRKKPVVQEEKYPISPPRPMITSGPVPFEKTFDIWTIQPSTGQCKYFRPTASQLKRDFTDQNIKTYKNIVECERQIKFAKLFGVNYKKKDNDRMTVWAIPPSSKKCQQFTPTAAQFKSLFTDRNRKTFKNETECEKYMRDDMLFGYSNEDNQNKLFGV